jgi:hypothetical protein
VLASLSVADIVLNIVLKQIQLISWPTLRVETGIPKLTASTLYPNSAFLLVLVKLHTPGNVQTRSHGKVGQVRFKLS